ncbi:hypothetical protein OF897_21500 [Chryseobacterium formosus]|uniref:Uncharacterized protein n=1 Tax=Chryseobacterium formosus TaxID=1537363 RepID=A0ABT3XXX9_9FLAO|nr:hypothetical protein [Chryseobacterium formosus]MCX8526493.1 hypothetical protein [Chryseobacterium formosus]
MNNYICYLKGVKQDKLIINLLAKIFRCNKETITDLLENETTQIKFENRVLDNVSEFQTELNVYIDGDIKTVFLNNLLFGIEISKHLGEEVIVNSNFNDPYQWILIKNDLFFLVDEIDNDTYGISIKESSKTKMSYKDLIRDSS